MQDYVPRHEIEELVRGFQQTLAALDKSMALGFSHTNDQIDGVKLAVVDLRGDVARINGAVAENTTWRVQEKARQEAKKEMHDAIRQGQGWLMARILGANALVGTALGILYWLTK